MPSKGFPHDVVRNLGLDRRNTPGAKPPKTGVWRKGDRILNTDPDPKTPAKAWAGWICIEAGEPGKWTPFGALAR